MVNLTEKSFVRGRLIPILGALIVFIISFSVLYMGENVGLSDNGDFRRVLIMNNIEYKDDTNHYYLFNENYKMLLDNSDSFSGAIVSSWQTNDEEEIYKSPHFMFIKLSKTLNVIANKISGNALSDYNIMYLAILYIFMLSVAAGVIFTFFNESSVKIQITIFLLFIFIFCDAGYLLYFNSFYGEPLQYTALMMLIAFGMLIYKRPSVPKAIGFFTALYFFAGSKLANIPYSLIVALLSVIIVFMRKDRLYRVGIIITAGLCVINIISLYTEIPEWMNRDTTYQAVFLGITKNSKTVEKDLEELGVSKEYAPLAGTHAYMEKDEYPIDITTEEFEKGFYEKVKKTDIAFFYLKHPIRLVGELCHAIENSAYIRPPVVGNSETVPMEFTKKFSGWSKIRVSLRFLYEPWVIFVSFILITLYMIFMNVFYIHNHKIESPARKYMVCALDILILGLWINLVMPIVCNGEADLAKHMFLFTNCVDILFAIGITALVVCPIKRTLAIMCAGALFTGLFYIDLPRKTVTLGRLNGEPLEWEKIRTLEDGTELLVTKECVGFMPYDDESNAWEISDVREWLNTDFLSEFSVADRELIVMTKNRNLLAFNQRERAEGGNHAHYWNFTKSLVYDMGDTAYYNYTEDMVFMPNLMSVKDISVEEDFWVMSPYTANDYMARYMNDDGFILHTDVRNEKGVRAMIRIKR